MGRNFMIIIGHGYLVSKKDMTEKMFDMLYNYIEGSDTLDLSFNQHGTYDETDEDKVFIYSKVEVLTNIDSSQMVMDCKDFAVISSVEDDDNDKSLNNDTISLEEQSLMDKILKDSKQNLLLKLCKKYHNSYSKWIFGFWD